MERLTKRIDGSLVFPNKLIGAMMTPSNDAMYQILTRLASYEDTGLDPDEIIGLKNTCEQLSGINDSLFKANQEMGKDLAEWKKAHDDGRLVVLPSKTVWELTMDAGPDCDMKCPVDAWDESLGCDLCSKAKQFAYERPCTKERMKELGKTVFLTREAAEAAMKGGEG